MPFCLQAKRIGRGVGSGKGKTAGRGHKGQKARAGELGLTPWKRVLYQAPHFKTFPPHHVF